MNAMPDMRQAEREINASKIVREVQDAFARAGLDMEIGGNG